MKDDSEPREYQNPHGPPEVAAMPFEPPPPAPASPAEEAIERHRDRLLAIDGVEGIDHGRAADGNLAIRIHIRDESVGRHLPAELDGYPVFTIVTGPYESY